MTRYAAIVLVAAWIIAAISAVSAVLFLEVNPSRNDLLSDELRFNQRYLDWIEHFPGTHDLTVVADMQGADGSDRSAEARAFIDALAERLREEPAVDRIDYGAPEVAFSPATARLLPREEFRAEIERAKEARPLLESPALSQLLAKTVHGMAEARDDDREDADHASAIAGLTELVRAVGDSLRSGSARDSLARVASDHRGSNDWQYLTTPNQRFLFLRMTPKLVEGEVNAAGPAIAAVRAHVAAVKAEIPDVQAGLTGVEVIEGDETDAAMRDASRTSIIAVIALSILLIYSFRGIRTPILLNLSLYTGVAWSFGYLLLTVGHLQILSVFFVLILLGLGMDFGVHLVSSIESARATAVREGGDTSLRHAFAEGFRRSSGGITLGAICTALSFGTSALTKFRGIAELGIIAAGGILLCLITTFTVLPSLIRLVHKNIGAKPVVHLPAKVAQRSIFRPVHSRPVLTLSIAGAFLAVCGWYASQIEFDYDLMRLQPAGVDSVNWQNKLLREGGVSAWYAVSIVDSLEMARQRSAQFLTLPTVGQVNGIAMLFPRDEGEKMQIAALARSDMEDVLREALQPGDSPPFNAAEEAQALVSQLISLRAIFRPQLERTDLPPEIRTAMEHLGIALDAAIDAATALNPTTLHARIADLHTAYTELRRDVALQLNDLLSTEPLTPDDFPPELLRPFIDMSNADQPRYAIEIHPRTPPDVTNALDPKFLPRFVRDLQSIDPDVTGVLMQIYYSGRLMVRSYLLAGLLSVALVVLVLTVALRSLYEALLCIVPIILGFGAVLAVMHVTDHALNAANIMVLPLMFGIGVDCGVHVVHRFHQDPHDRPLGLSHGTGKGITVTTVTNILGFGAMLFASHRGIQSLGMVMATGMTLTLLASVIVLPAWLELRVRGRENRR